MEIIIKGWLRMKAKDGMKVCSRCGHEKPVSEFHMTSYRNTIGVRVYVPRGDCKACRNNTAREAFVDNRAAILAKAKSKYAEDKPWLRRK